MSRNRLKQLACCIRYCLYILLAINASKSALAESMKIGVIGPLSGDLATYGIPTKNGTELAIKNINKSGGVLNSKLELVALDDVCEPNTAVTTANKIIGEKVIGVIGHLCSGATRAVLDIYKQANVVVISPASTNPDLTLDEKSPNFFRTIAHDAAQANLQVDYIKNSLKAKNVAILHDHGTYGEGLAKLVKEGLEKQKSTKVSLYDGIKPGQSDYIGILKKIKNQNVDAVVFGGYHPEAAKLVMNARSKTLRLQVPFISGDGVRDNKLIEIAGKDSIGYLASAPVDTSSNSMSQKVTKEYEQTYKEKPGTFTLAAYAGVLALVEAVKAAKSTEYAKVREQLLKKTFTTPIGNISFDKKGDVIGSGFTMYKVESGSNGKGKFVMVK